MLVKFRTRLRGSTCLVVADNRNTEAGQYRCTARANREAHRVSLSDMVAVAAGSADVECGGGGFALSRPLQMAGHAVNLRVARGETARLERQYRSGGARAAASTYPATACVQRRETGMRQDVQERVSRPRIEDVHGSHRSDGRADWLAGSARDRFLVGQ